jgi:chromosome partitioning protein
MKTVAIIGQKGGTGKTTLAQILAVGAARDGAVSAIVDLDPQVSACQWSDLRQNDSPIVLDAQPARLPKVLETARAQGVGLVVIDTAGRAEQAALAAAKAADVVLIPLQPSVADLTTVEGALNIVKLAGSSRYVAVLTRVKAKGTRHTETADWLAAQGIEVCPVVIGDRVTYQDAYAAGQTPPEFDPRSKAATECEELNRFVGQLLNELTHEGVKHG